MLRDSTFDSSNTSPRGQWVNHILTTTQLKQYSHHYCRTLMFIKVHETQKLINPCHAKFIFGNIKIFLHFLQFLNTEMMQAVGIFPRGREGTFSSYTANRTITDDLAMWRARASSTMILTQLSQNIPFSTSTGLNKPTTLEFPQIGQCST